MFARGAGWFVLPCLAVSCALWAAFAAVPRLILGVPALLVTALSALVVCFFRDPERAPEGSGALSPADGVVMRAEMEDGRAFVSIFMNVYDVHVNRLPIPARLDRTEYRPGGHIPAFSKDSDRNERLRSFWTTPDGPMRIDQIAGTLARRVRVWISATDSLGRGDRFGMILFSSRVDVLLPRGYEPTVSRGDRVRAGASVIARQREVAPSPDRGGSEGGIT